MKKIIFLAAAWTAFSLLSCGGEMEDKTDHPDYLGYFIGSVNGVSYHLENTEENQDVVRPCIYGRTEQGAEEVYWQAVFENSEVRTWGIGLHLVSLTGNVIKMQGDGWDPAADWTAISIQRKDTDEYDVKLYFPMKEPFTVFLDKVVYKDEEPDRPYIYGRMEGILYNLYDKSDSIIVKDARFGVRGALTRHKPERKAFGRRNPRYGWSCSGFRCRFRFLGCAEECPWVRQIAETLVFQVFLIENVACYVLRWRAAKITASPSRTAGLGASFSLSGGNDAMETFTILPQKAFPRLGRRSEAFPYPAAACNPAHSASRGSAFYHVRERQNAFGKIERKIKSI